MIYKDLTTKEQVVYNKVCLELADLDKESIKHILRVLVNVRYEYGLCPSCETMSNPRIVLKLDDLKQIVKAFDIKKDNEELQTHIIYFHNSLSLEVKA